VKRYFKKGGVLHGTGPSATYYSKIGQEALASTIQHMKDHLKDEIRAEIEFVGNKSTVGDLELLVCALDAF